MSAAGEFIATCRRRKVEIRIVGDDVSLRGTKEDLDLLMPRLTLCVNDVHEIMSDFLHTIPPRQTERH